MPRPARIDPDPQLSALIKTPLVLQSRAARMRKRVALRRSVREVMINPLGFDESLRIITEEIELFFLSKLRLWLTL